MASYTASASGGVNVLYRWDFGDGTATVWSNVPTATHTFALPGIYNVTVTANDDRGVPVSRTAVQTVYPPSAGVRPTASSTLAFEPRTTGNARLWVVNQDNDSVTVFDAVTHAKLREIAVGTAPRAVAVAPNGLIWVTNRQSATISVINPDSLAVANTIGLRRASQPYGLAFAPDGAHAFVALGATGQLVKLDAVSFAQLGSVNVGPNPRHIAIAPDGSVYVARFITPPLPGESTAAVQTTVGSVDYGGEVVVVDGGALSVTRTIVLRHSDKPDFENQGRGIPNYLGAPAISPDATHAWVPSKQDNIKRGALRDGTGLNFQSTVRAVSSRIALAAGAEDHAARIDHDNAGVASAAIFDQRGIYLFVALETSREVAVVSAHGGHELFRFDVGRAPQALALSADGQRLYVNNFMDRTVGVFDLAPLLTTGAFNVPALATLSAVGTEKLSATVLKGKQLFYDARDPRLARDRYLSCASCHNDGGSDGRVWDLTSMGEGLRNTINLRGRAAGQGRLHWSNNFDELQDFEGQIRTLALGTGLMSDADFNAGTRSQPLGDPKAGRSADLDALAAYVASLATFDASPYRTTSGALTSAASAGKTVFTNMNCGSCHSGTAFSGSGANTLVDIGTIKPASGSRLGGALNGIDVPTLRDVWATAPYLHDGSATTLGDAVRAHQGVTISDANLANLVAYLQQIGARGKRGARQRRRGHGLDRPLLQQHRTERDGAPHARGERQLWLGLRLARQWRQQQQLLGALERHDPGAGHRHVSLPDRFRRRRPPVGRRGANVSTTGRRMPRPPIRAATSILWQASAIRSPSNTTRPRARPRSGCAGSRRATAATSSSRPISCSRIDRRTVAVRRARASRPVFAGSAASGRLLFRSPTFVGRYVQPLDSGVPRKDRFHLPQHHDRTGFKCGQAPAALIGRLAREERTRGRGPGELLLADAVRTTVG